MQKHWGELVSGSHKNPKMLRTFKKYGGDFVVTQLVVGSPSYCENVEAALLSGIPNISDSLNCHRNSTGGWLGQDWSDESRKKLSDAKKGTTFSEEAKAKAAETRKTSQVWAAHQERMRSPEHIAKRCEKAAQPESRAKAVATRIANGHKPFSDETRQRQRDESKARVFAALDWAVENNETRDSALKKFSCSWDGLKKYQPEWEAENGTLSLPKRASGERSGMYKHGMSKEIKRRRTPEEMEARWKTHSQKVSGENNPMHGRKHSAEARAIQSAAAKAQAERNREIGYVVPDSARQKMSAALKGRKHSDEHKRNHAFAQLGKKYSTPVGIFYTSRECEAATGVKAATVMWRCKNNYKNQWSYV